MARVIIFGGYGTFGALVARELAAMGIEITIAGRDASRAAAFAASLGPAHRGIAADLNDAQSCRKAIAGHALAANCAGPFQAFDAALLEACLDEGCHYADIADDRAYCARVRHFGERFAQRRRAAVYGCSSLPAISGALGLLAGAGATAAPARARVTLFIGNDNPKGGAAIRSLVASLGKPFPAPQGTIKGFWDREVVALPAPIGRRAGFNVNGPEYDLFASLLGVRAVTVKVVFELWPSNYFFAALAIFGRNYGEATARLLEKIGGCTRLGTSAGAVMTELFYGDGSSRRALLWGRKDGQRMAALPCALVAQSLCAGQFENVGGAMTAYELLGAQGLVEQIQRSGFELD